MDQGKNHAFFFFLGVVPCTNNKHFSVGLLFVGPLFLAQGVFPWLCSCFSKKHLALKALPGIIKDFLGICSHRSHRTQLAHQEGLGNLKNLQVILSGDDIEAEQAERWGFLPFLCLCCWISMCSCGVLFFFLWGVAFFFCVCLWVCGCFLVFGKDDLPA